MSFSVTDPSWLVTTVTVIVATIVVLIGLGLVNAAKDLRAARYRGEPPIFAAWFSGGWYERHPVTVAVFGWITVGIGTSLLVLGVAKLAVSLG